MLRRRRILFWGVLLAVGGALGTTLGFGLYLRSGWYADSVAERLTRFFDLPTEVGSVVPLDLRSLELRDVVVWLPEKRGRVFGGRRIVWEPSRSEADESGYELKIRGGSFWIDSERWGARDYRRVLDSGLGHNFAEIGLRRVELSETDLNWVDRGLALSTRQATGSVIFDEPGVGQVSLLSNWLNDHRVDEPIHIFARFLSNGGVRIEQVTLDAPRVPLAALGLESLLGVQSLQGDFSGRATYREVNGSQRVELRGRVDGLRLEDLGGVIGAEGLVGSVGVWVDEGRITDGRLERLTFRGRIDDVLLAPIAAMFSLPDAGGRAKVFVHQGEMRDGKMSWLGLSGRVEGLSLETLAQFFGQGQITGSLRVEIPTLVIREGRIGSADLRFVAEPPEDEPGWISRELLSSLAQRVAGVTLPDILPERIEYARLGVRVVIEGETVRVLGTHGRRNTTILTLKVFGRDLGVLFQPARSYELQPILDRIRAEAERLNTEKLREWLRVYPGPASPSGSSLPDR